MRSNPSRASKGSSVVLDCTVHVWMFQVLVGILFLLPLKVAVLLRVTGLSLNAGLGLRLLVMMALLTHRGVRRLFCEYRLSVGRRRATGAHVENYFSEQPSGRGLLHVQHAGGHSSSDAAAAAAAAEAAAQVPAPRIGRYVEAPSGRSLLRTSLDQDDDTTPSTHLDMESSIMEFSTSTSEGMESSRWGDSDAASHPYGSSAYRSTSAAQGPTGRGAVRGGSGASAGTATAPISLPRSREMGTPPARPGLYGAVTPGSAAASRPRDSFKTVDTAASLGSGANMAIATGEEGDSNARPRTGVDPQGQVIMQQNSSSSSEISRVNPPHSEMSTSSPGLIGRDSWRSGPGTDPELENVHSGDTDMTRRDSTAPSPGGGERDPGADDGDFGTVWLASRQHARQFEDQRSS